MSSTTPNRSSRFAAYADTKLTPALWTDAFAAAFGEIEALDVLRADVERAITDAANGNLDTVLREQLATRLTSTQAAFDTLKAALDLAQDQLVAIQTGIVLASSVRVTPGGMFADVTGVQEAVERLSEAVADDPDFASKIARLDSPVLVGNPTAPTPSVGDADKSIATTEFVARETRRAMAYALAFGGRR